MMTLNEWGGEWKKVYHAKSTIQKEAGVAILIADK